MYKKFRCSRLTLTRDGTVKRLNLGVGGGTRSCDWDNIDMNFEDVHHQLLHIYNLSNMKHKTSLYDYEHRQLNVKQYKTFGEYINRFGLNGNSTVINLCTRQDDDVQRKVRMRNNNSFIPSRHVVRNESYPNRQQNNQSSREYSFINSSNQLMKNISELINQNGSDAILIKLFECICIIHGYVSAEIVPLQQQLNQSEVSLDLNRLNYIYEICEATKTLLCLNMDKFAHIRMYSTIRTTFFQFHNNVQILRNRCIKKSENNDNLINTTSTITRSNIDSTDEDHHEINSSESSQEPSNEKFPLFQSTLNYLQHSLDLLPSERLTFHTLIALSIRKLKSARLNLNLFNQSSICDAKKVILSLRDQFNKEFDKQDIMPWKSESDRRLYGTCNNTLRAIRFLLISLDRYQIKICNKN